MKVSHSNTLWLGYKLYSSFVLHNPASPAYSTSWSAPFPPTPMLSLFGRLMHNIWTLHCSSNRKGFGGYYWSTCSESGCFVFLSQVSVLSPFFHFFYLSFSPSLFSILLFFLSFFIRFIHYFSVFLLFIPSFPVLGILCSFLLSRCRLFLSFVHSFPFHGLSSPFIFHLFFLSPFFCLFFLTFFCSFFHWFCLLFFLSDFLSICSFFIHSFFFSLSLPFFLSHSLSFVLSFLPSFVVSLLWSFSPINSFIILLPILLVLPFICSFFRPFILLFFRPFIPSPSPFLSFILSFSLLPRAFLCSFIHSFILSLLDR